jgi:RNA polymerase sigma-70 factor, ECF subfamily
VELATAARAARFAASAAITSHTQTPRRHRELNVRVAACNPVTIIETAKRSTAFVASASPIWERIFNSPRPSIYHVWQSKELTYNGGTFGISRSLEMGDLAHSQERELRALMTASLDGDAGAYRTLLGRLTGHLRAYYRRRFAKIGHGPAEAEDLLQEALIAIHTHRDTYDPSQAFTPWFHAIARYKFLDYLRRTKSSFKNVSIEDAEELSTFSDMTAVESGLDLQRLMSELSAKARDAIQYVKLEGMSVSEAASRSGMSESAVKVAVHRGLKALALRIRERSGT